MLKDKLSRFRLIALVEGYSFLILLFIAMPVKYIGGEPILVKIVGMTHGILFLLFIAFLYECFKEYRWKSSFMGYAMLASLLPFGTFFLDKKLQKPELIKTNS